MITKSQAVQVGLAVAVVHDLSVHRRNKKRMEKLAARNRQLIRDVNYNAQVGKYLISILKEHDIPLTKFDLIALNNPIV